MKQHFDLHGLCRRRGRLGKDSNDEKTTPEFALRRGTVLRRGFRSVPRHVLVPGRGLEIVEPITFKEEFKLKSFFVMGPDGVSVEVVEAKPIPEGLWD